MKSKFTVFEAEILIFSLEASINYKTNLHPDEFQRYFWVTTLSYETSWVILRMIII
ncbi:hypothetical protein PJIAN_2102 [Paludibacter jiangxiensis]|uniref:Uncharacterized protein n=1 Tax=Paludibacter jiangxiensis TaxID=681398 RepID=A0A170ZD46_9BACT|nr:hypothetical protein PJIAN_2102 [Paludibacter jiangxiensis]